MLLYIDLSGNPQPFKVKRGPGSTGPFQTPTYTSMDAHVRFRLYLPGVDSMERGAHTSPGGKYTRLGLSSLHVELQGRSSCEVYAVNNCIYHYL